MASLPERYGKRNPDDVSLEIPESQPCCIRSFNRLFIARAFVVSFGRWFVTKYFSGGGSENFCIPGIACLEYIDFLCLSALTNSFFSPEGCCLVPEPFEVEKAI